MSQFEKPGLEGNNGPKGHGSRGFLSRSSSKEWGSEVTPPEEQNQPDWDTIVLAAAMGTVGLSGEESIPSDATGPQIKE
jgi:hypothetical protein